MAAQNSWAQVRQQARAQETQVSILKLVKVDRIEC